MTCSFCQATPGKICSFHSRISNHDDDVDREVARLKEQVWLLTDQLAALGDKAERLSADLMAANALLDLLGVGRPEQPWLGNGE